ncbi:MAG: hypothetical protein ACK56I_15850, partial [bacterium]
MERHALRARREVRARARHDEVHDDRGERDRRPDEHEHRRRDAEAPREEEHAKPDHAPREPQHDAEHLHGAPSERPAHLAREGAFEAQRRHPRARLRRIPHRE